MSLTSSEYLSKEAFVKIQKELEHLTKVKRREISERIEESISLGDISESAEYQEAKEEQLMNEGRIAEIEDLLSRALVVSGQRTNKVYLRVDLGCFVVLKKKKTEEILKYKIVSFGESDPSENKISSESPLGSSLMGRKAGENVEVFAPNGKISYIVVEII
ncbi:transcription elongation factor GreA [Patescibacteria group bacterium]|nr:transcription elongation factor GreA [Patescibacteria group bacterium]